MEPERIQASRRLILLQLTLGFLAQFLFALPYLRRAHGLEKLNPRQRYLFVSNHVSLLDTVLLGSLFWRSGNHPLLVLGAKKAWCDSWFRTLLSRPLGFLLERGRLNPRRIHELEVFGRKINDFNLLVFPEGTRGNGLTVAECQPGIFHVAQAARAPILPIFIQNMHLVSTKTGPFHPISGLQKVEVHFGQPIFPEDYLHLSREELTELIRTKIAAAQSPEGAAYMPAVKAVNVEISR